MCIAGFYDHTPNALRSVPRKEILEMEHGKRTGNSQVIVFKARRQSIPVVLPVMGKFKSHLI